MKSMTGYASREIHDDKIQLALELKSYNNRYLDVNVSLPSALGALEPRLREFLSERISRGKIELYVRYRQLEEQVELSIDAALAKSYVDGFGG